MTHTDPHWGAEDRDLKAKKIVEVLELLTDRPLSTLSCVDIGCGSGGISFHLSPAFKSVCGIDPEPWLRWDEFVAERPNLSFQEGSVDTLGMRDASADVVICNQVYEHVPSPEALIAQIHRILKPGGICYFAGPNLLYPIEPHVHWPFVHWIPRPWALALLRKFSPEKEKELDAYSTTYWKLRHWLRDFIILDAVPSFIKHKWRWLRPVPLRVLEFFAFLSPGFIFVLTKPGKS